MPRLPTYDAPLGGLPVAGGRRATAEDFGADIGAAVTQIGIATAKVYKDVEDHESRKALVRSSEIRAKYAKRLDEAAQSSEDLDRIRQDMNDELSKVGDDFATRQGQDQLSIYAANTNQMFDQQASNITVQRAAADAKLDAKNFLNSASALMLTRPDYLPTALDDVDGFVRTLTRVSPETRSAIAQDLKNELNVTAAIASARIMPEETKAKLEAGGWDLTPDQRLQAIGMADTTLRAKRADEALQRELAQQDRVARNEAAYDELRKSIFVGKPGIEAAVLDNADLLAPTRDHLLGLMERRTRELKSEAYRTDPSVFNALRARIDLPPGHQNKILSSQEVWAMYGRESGISKEDAAFLEKRLEDAKTPDGMTWSQAESEALRNLSKELDKSTLLSLDAGGGARVQAFVIHLRNRADAFLKAGKDRYSLLRPGPDYIGNDIPMFLSGAQQMQRDLTKQLDEALTPKRKTLDEIFKP